MVAMEILLETLFSVWPKNLVEESASVSVFPAFSFAHSLSFSTNLREGPHETILKIVFCSGY